MDTMEHQYNNFPQDDYALALLTEAAMQTSHPIESSSSSGVVSADHEITNHQRHPHSSTQRNIESHNNTHRLSGLSHDFDPSVLSPVDMAATLAFGSTSMGGRNTYMDSAFRGIGPQISRNFAGNLSILNAETYDARMVERGRDDSLKQSKERPLLFGLTGAQRLETDVEYSENPPEAPESATASKKRTKRKRVEVVSPSIDEDEDGKKKSRGRPRVDTKDETAADRRRTQIRMAQRAYRHRKETTISSLEKKVQDLRGTNEEMSNIFISLYDYAVGRGLLQREPEFGQQLQSTTERFLALAKASNEDMAHEGEQSEEPERHDVMTDEKEGAPPKRKGRRTPPKNRKEPTPTPPPPPAPSSPLWGGFPLGQQKNSLDGMQFDFLSQGYENRARGDLQVITRPTEDNASFPFEFMDLQQYRVELPSIDDFSQYFLPQSQPPLPRSYSYTEFSFGRRLQREAMESGLRLLTMENPPADVLKRCFGFSLQYESKENIAKRIRGLVAAATKESLQNWRAPFVNIGGNGTFYPMPEGVDEDLMPKQGTGYSMGPFSPAIAEAEELLDDDMHCKKEGFEGEFFDSNDVEGYLRSRGLEIPESADVVTAQIDFSVISEGASPETQSSGTISTTLSPMTPKSPTERMVSEAYSLDPEKLDSEAYPFPLASTIKDSSTEPSFFTMAGDPYASKTPNFKPDQNKATIALNVQTLISELIRRAVCLGRGPGFRPSDVNAAIVAAVRAR